MVIVLIGPMGCGKTTIGHLLAEKLGWRFADGDDYHPPENVEKMRVGIPLEDSDRIPWLTILFDQIKQAQRDNTDLIIACSALKKIYRDQLGINQREVRSVYLKGSYELLKKRVESRSHRYMNKELLHSQLKTLEEPPDGITVSIDKTPDQIVESIITKATIKL